MAEDAEGRARLLDAAIAAARRGWPVLPLRPFSKRPAIRNWPSRASTAPAQLAEWWAVAPWNIGIACGPAGLVVLDLDAARPDDEAPAAWAGRQVSDGYDVLAHLAAEAGQPMPVDTYTVATPRGRHLYFAARPGVRLANTAGRLGPSIDTRAGGGYVVAAGSMLRTAGIVSSYRVGYDVPPAPLPGWIAAALAHHPDPGMAERAAPVAAGRLGAYAAAALAAEARTVRAAAVGTRNHRLFRAAGNLGELVGAGLLGEEEVLGGLMAAAAGHIGVVGFTVAEARRAIGNGLARGRRTPRAVTTMPPR
jgi:hypothetical protein